MLVYNVEKSKVSMVLAAEISLSVCIDCNDGWLKCEDNGEWRAKNAAL